MNAAAVSPQLERLLSTAARVFEETDSEAMLLMVDGRLDWERVRQATGTVPVLVAADDEADLVGTTEHGFTPVPLDAAGLPVHERITQALLDCVANETIAPEARIEWSTAASRRVSSTR